MSGSKTHLKIVMQMLSRRKDTWYGFGVLISLYIGTFMATFSPRRCLMFLTKFRNLKLFP